MLIDIFPFTVRQAGEGKEILTCLELLQAVCVCVYVCMSVCVYVHECVFMWVSVCVYVCECVYVWVSLYVKISLVIIHLYHLSMEGFILPSLWIIHWYSRNKDIYSLLWCYPRQGLNTGSSACRPRDTRRDSRADRGSLLPLEMNACLPGCVWNATPRSLSPLERNIGFWTQA